MSLFKKIFLKNLKKARSHKDLQKLTDDIGKPQGVVTITGTNVETGKVVHHEIQRNQLTALSKSNIIRLISQGTSPWIGAIDPADLVISKMRFSNQQTGDLPPDWDVYYYDLSEASSRSITGDYPGGNGALGVGGTLPGEASASVVDNFALTDPRVTTLTNGNKLVTIFNQERPPGHGTLVVKLHTGNPATPVETITFATEPYTRGSSGTAPSEITSATGFVSTPDGVRALNVPYSVMPGDTETKLLYDFTSGSAGWKLLIEEVAAPAAYTEIQLEYQTGAQNIINGIVPRSGVNSGTGVTLLDRYGSSGGDSYSIGNNIEYRSSDTGFIDDFAVTFSVTMSGPDGNGDLPTTAPTADITYTSAFLHCENDDLFSAISLTTPFSKDETTSYLIQWSLLAPL